MQAILMTVAGLCGIFAQAVLMRILVACFKETQIIIFGEALQISGAWIQAWIPNPIFPLEIQFEY